MAGTDSGRLIARLPFTKGALIGACAFLFGYLITYATTIERIRAELAKQQIEMKLSFLGIGGIQPWKITGWFYYAAHFIDISTKGMINIRTLNLLTLSTNNPRVLLFVLPPILLILAGMVTARLAAAEGVTFGAASGLTVVPGYFALAFVGAFATQINFVFVVAGPDITTALVAGFVYPLVFGPLGGVLAATIQRSRASSSPHGSNP